MSINSWKALYPAPLSFPPIKVMGFPGGKTFMNIQALDIKVGDCIIAYCKQKMQPCTVQRLLSSTQNNITLKVSTSAIYRESASFVVQFHREALIEMAGLTRTQEHKSKVNVSK